MKRQFLSIAAALLLTGTGSVLTVGCGGGNNDSGSGVRDANGFVTRAEEAKYSNDALILASREATDAPIPTTTAVSIDTDLAAIRARYPALNAVKARAYDDLKSILVVARTSSPLGTAWSEGKTVTGAADVDALLTRYKVDSIKSLSGSTNTTFQVIFTDPLNTRKVLETLEAVVAPEGSGLVSVGQNLAIGDGDQVTRTSTGSTRVYQFTKGWGDCFAGCISRHVWTVTVAEDSTIQVEESGTPLSSDSAR